MKYQCNHCGRLFDCPETISFCPFCGTAYASQNMPVQPITARIVVGTDSERTIQEKYWLMVREEMLRALSAVFDKIPDDDQYEKKQLDLAEWLWEQKQCRSTAQFKQRCDAFLRRISAALNHDTSQIDKREPIDMDRIGEKIKQTGIALAHALGEAYFPEEMPALTYEPVFNAMQKSEETQHVSEDFYRLLQAVNDAKSVLYEILDENGIFVVLSILGTLSEEESFECEPIKLSKQLHDLSKRDYDPLFGEEYDDFVLAFWEAVMKLAHVINNTLELPKMDENEIIKIQALQSYVFEWKEVLSVMIDQVYQSHEQNMVIVHQKIRKLCASFDEIEE